MTAIVPSDYNNIRDKIVLVMGTGSTGYGQTITSITANQNNIISANLWNGLRTDILKARQHQTGIDQSNAIPFLTRTTPITTAIRDTFDAVCNQAVTDQRLCALNQGSLESIITPVNFTSSWNTVLYHRITVTFATANAAKYFFNAGGQIRFYASRAGVAATSKDTEWTNILGDIAAGGTIKGFGTAFIDYTQSGTATDLLGNATNDPGRAGTGTAIGFYDLLTANPGQQIFIANSNPALGYGSNDYNISARIDATPTGTGRILTFVIQFRDDASGTTGLVDESVTGTLRSYCQIFRPSGDNVSVAGPTAVQEGPGLTVLT